MRSSSRSSNSTADFDQNSLQLFADARCNCLAGLAGHCATSASAAARLSLVSRGVSSVTSKRNCLRSYRPERANDESSGVEGDSAGLPTGAPAAELSRTPQL